LIGKGEEHDDVLWCSVSQQPGRGPVLGPSINYIGPSSYRKNNLPGRGLTKVQSHRCSVYVTGKAKLSLYSTKNYAVKVYGGMDI
jgi:hypothetical protein